MHLSALTTSQRIQEEIALVVSLKACAAHKDLFQGNRIHSDVLRRGLLESNVFVGSTLINMYVKCGAFGKAQEILGELSDQSVVSWTALIAGYAQRGHGIEALKCFEQMKCEGPSPDEVTLLAVLQACSSIEAIKKGMQIHSEIVRKGMLRENTALGNALVDMYAKCGVLEIAQQVFDGLAVWNVVSWTALIAGYVEHGYGEEAIHCFEQMKQDGFFPNAVTFGCILKACGSLGAGEKGKQTHVEIVGWELLEGNQVLGTALVDMYAKCGAILQAQQVFEELSDRDVVAWSALIAGLVQHGHGEEALGWYELMKRENVSPDTVTLLSILQACASIGAIEKGKEIHAEIDKDRLLEKDGALGSALVDMYTKFGAMVTAEQVFDELPVRHAVCWTVLIGGYCQHGCGEEALSCFDRMQHEGLSPDTVTMLCILQICGSMGAIERGKEVHAAIVKEGVLGNDRVLGTAMVDMYAKCGVLAKARQAFDDLPVWDVISWNVLIAGYLQVGSHGAVLESFGRMIGEGVEPNMATFIIVLSACNHLNLVDKGTMYFESMSDSYGILPTLEHYTCMVNLLGRAGHFHKAMTVIEKMPSAVYLPAWFVLLGACQKWGNVKLGKLAFDQAILVDGKAASAYVCMSNIYAAAGMQGDAHGTV